MFIDYYSILEVDNESSFEEIKSAFRKQCIKWHPDKNLGKDTTEKMQLINEAYLILKDSEARAKYDIEWEDDSREDDDLEYADAWDKNDNGIPDYAEDDR